MGDCRILTGRLPVNIDAHILVVDDNENNRFMLLQHLRRLGFRQITEASDGAVALDIIHESSPDLVLLDVIMPDTDGINVLETLRREGRLADLPVVMVSAHDNMDIVVRCIELGAEDYLTKPIQMQMLRARISAILEKRRLRQIEMEFLTHFDPETHLPNRHALLERIDRMLASARRFALVAVTRRDQGSIALGASEDDTGARLRALNDVIQSSHFCTDIVARVGDGTLAWLLPDVQPDHLLLQWGGGGAAGRICCRGDRLRLGVGKLRRRHRRRPLGRRERRGRRPAAPGDERGDAHFSGEQRAGADRRSGLAHRSAARIGAAA